MRTDRRIDNVEALLTPRQRFFCDCWFNLVHEASLDAFRVRAMNPVNIVRELLKMFDVEHAKEPDIGRVALEAREILADQTILGDPVFNPVAAQLCALLDDALGGKQSKPADEGSKAADAAKAAGASLMKHRSLIDAFGRELLDALERHFVARCIAWLSRELSVVDEGSNFDEVEPHLVKIEAVLSTLLSTLVNQGWSFASLFTLYRSLLLPVDAGASGKPYAFDVALAEVFQRLTAEPKPYRVTFAISNVSKPTSFPEQVGSIAFSVNPPDLGARSSGYVQRYARAVGGRLFATMVVEAQDGRIAGSIASDRIAAVLDVVRYDYERKNLQLADSFLVEKPGKHILLPLPGTVPNPDSSLGEEQLGIFMRRLQELVGSGTLSADTKDRIYSAFRLYRIGAETSNFENKLINWWTAIEYLVKGSGGASDGIGAGVEHSLAPTVTLSYLPKLLLALRVLLVDQLKIELTDAAGTPVELKSLGLAAFYAFLQDQAQRAAIEAACADRPFVLVHLRRLFGILTDKAKLAAALANHERRLRWHVQRIYRARCDIVHSAQRMVDATLLCANLEFYLKSVLATFLEALHRHPTMQSAREFFERQEHAIRQVRAELVKSSDATLVTMLARKDAVAA
ncbi:hypothetical protein SAMN05443245_7619 [Paraburkholderia fungorum]|uniref:Uncharacterized protein n=1 Tax=Paraburkholderia fungorum TaxID=134537 RepID=A0A1H1JZH7_9BURK|nr:hypothetical protein [Paraburkholderia fungorum]SDR55180.1 hypothetical protein SAMN05443245_7619 [Paraburkholderia fungorum]